MSQENSGETAIERLYTETELAQLLNLKVTTLRKLRCAGASPLGVGHIPYLRLGRKCVRYRKADIDVYLAAHLVSPEGGAA